MARKQIADMTYEDAIDHLKRVKAFAKHRQSVQDRRMRTCDLVIEQLQDVYRVCCTVENHLRVARRRDREKKT